MMRKPARGADGRAIYSYRKGPSRAGMPRDDPEARLQKRIAQYLEYCLPAEVVWTASLSGVKLGPKARNDARAMGLRRGCPDIVLVVPRKGPFWIEVKSEQGQLSQDQKRWREAIGEARWCEARSVEDVEAACLRWGIEMQSQLWRGSRLAQPDARSDPSPGPTTSGSRRLL